MEYVRGILEREQFVGAAGAGLEMPTGYARALFNFLNEMRAANYIVLPASVVATGAKPSDAQLNAFLQAHHDAFSTPEYREVGFAWIAPPVPRGQDEGD